MAQFPLPALTLLLPIIVFLCAPATSDAWGPLGHKIICGVAQKRVSSRTRAKVKEMLRDRNLEDVCSWADDVRKRCGYEWSRPLHYVSIRDASATAFNYNRDCPEDQCVVGAIADNVSYLRTNVLQSKTENLEETLKFLVHFMGDVHQPLHAGFESDRGGKAVAVSVDPRSTVKTDLHEVWDKTIIAWALRERHRRNFEIMVQNITDISKEIKKKEDFDASPYSGYAMESFTDARKYAYKDLKDKDLREKINPELKRPYMENRYDKSVKMRLAQAGWRLTQLLDFIFDPPPPCSQTE